MNDFEFNGNEFNAYGLEFDSSASSSMSMSSSLSSEYTPSPYSGDPKDSSPVAFQFSVPKLFEESMTITSTLDTSKIVSKAINTTMAAMNTSLQISGTFGYSVPFAISLDMDSLVERAVQRMRSASSSMSMSSSLSADLIVAPYFEDEAVDVNDLNPLVINSYQQTAESMAISGSESAPSFTQDGDVLEVDLLPLGLVEGIHVLSITDTLDNVIELPFLVYNSAFFDPNDIVEVEVPMGSGIHSVVLDTVRIDFPRNPAEDYLTYYSRMTLKDTAYMPYIALSDVIELGPTSTALYGDVSIYFTLTKTAQRFADVRLVKREGNDWFDTLEVAHPAVNVYKYTTASFSPFFIAIIPPEGFPVKSMIDTVNPQSVNKFVPDKPFYARSFLWDQ